eukprot:gnl/TRDRNA2_/TRDRNA2_162826_c0_seq1.p1 gnl/TRDRNA2_/TRDRNA2_162826_c0~~gnl/TRDRNA2_/TRDRNA2_162826_c0_seq1.p1  ORF type:complete len:228 (+),score=43.61 gnl/TRDRNA2_/TRDRNA2_162826_c0_seq1:97-780(+)
MYTLFAAIAGGGDWRACRSLGEVGWVWVCFFVLYVTFGHFAVLNVITAFFCQSAVESAQHDQEMLISAQMAYKDKYVSMFRELFTSISSRTSGAITLAEFEAAMEEPAIQAYFATLELETSDAWTLFKLLDSHKIHSIDLEEFVVGCLRLRGTAKSIDVATMMHNQKLIARQLSDITHWMEDRFSRIDHHIVKGVQQVSPATLLTGVDRSCINAMHFETKKPHSVYI